MTENNSGEVLQEVLDAADSVLENAGEAVDSARTLNSRDLGIGITIGATVGFAGGYFLLRKKLQTKFEKIADEEIAAMREHYNQKLLALDGEKEKEKLEDVLEKQEYATKGEGVVPYHKISVTQEEEDEAAELEDEVAITEPATVTNIFNRDSEPVVELDWDYAAEAKNRTDPAVPYVIHKDEHDNNEKDYEQITLTYFEGDDVICDTNDKIIEDQDGVVGLGNLSRFGHGSGDPKIVYVRNDKLKVDIEVVHSDGKYAIEVAGFKEDELKHSDSMRRRLPRRSEYDASD